MPEVYRICDWEKYPHGFRNELHNHSIKKSTNAKFVENTPGTAGGPGGRDQTLAVKSRKNVRKITFFS